jgi:hypothetical protein
VDFVFIIYFGGTELRALYSSTKHSTTWATPQFCFDYLNCEFGTNVKWEVTADYTRNYGVCAIKNQSFTQ